MNLGRLEGKTAIVTGSSRGIGRAIAERFAAEGARVVVNYVRAEADAASLVDAIAAAGGIVVAVQGDVSRVGDVRRIIQEGVDRFGRIDIVVNNAGVWGSSSLLDTTDEEWDHFMNVNLRSQYLVAKWSIGAMIKQDPINEVRGRLINVTSQLGFTAPPGHLTYAVTKAAIAHMTRQLAVDYGSLGIIVNGVAPGQIITGTHPGEMDYLAAGTVDDATRYSLARTPFYRLGRPEDVAGAALFLASDDCTFVSGANLMVDGGWTAY